MRRALPFVLFTIAVVTALWLSAQPDRGRPSAARELAVTPPSVAAGPRDAGDRQNAVWPPPSGIEAPQPALSAQPAPEAAPAPDPGPTSAREPDPDPEVVAVLQKVLGGPVTEDPDRNGAPEFDPAAFGGPVRDKSPQPQSAPPPLPIVVAGAAPPADPPAAAPPVSDPAPQRSTAAAGEPVKPTVDPTLPPEIQQLERDRIEKSTVQARGWTGSDPR